MTRFSQTGYLIQQFLIVEGASLLVSIMDIWCRVKRGFGMYFRRILTVVQTLKFITLGLLFMHRTDFSSRVCYGDFLGDFIMQYPESGITMVATADGQEITSMFYHNLETLYSVVVLGNDEPKYELVTKHSDSY